MSEVKMPRDDATILVNPKAATHRTVHAVDPAHDALPVQPHEEAPPVARAAPRRPRKRRQGERRRKEMPILLDTRCGDDRRGAAETDDADGEEDQGRKGPGIDVFV